VTESNPHNSLTICDIATMSLVKPIE